MAEAVGIVLAVVPLLVSCFEDYGKLATYVKAFKRYTKSVQTHVAVLNIQRTIFLKANERLLGQCLQDVDQARCMLADRDHSSWRDEDICTLYVERLADSRQAFEDCINLISNELASIRTTLSALDGAARTPHDDAKSVKKRFKYALNESTISNSLKNLAEKTTDFLTLIDLTMPSAPRSAPYKSSLSLRKQMCRFSEVQETASDLYQALGHACTKHTGHQAHLSLQPSYSDPSQVRFTIAFSQLSLNPLSEENAPCSKSTWLKVESRLHGRLQSTIEDGAIVTTQQSLKRALDAPAPDTKTTTTCRKKLVKKRVQILDPRLEAKVIQVPSPSLMPVLSNLCTNSNFCNQLQKFIADAKPCTAAVGYLELSGSPKHLIYVDSTSQTVIRTHGASGTMESLHKMLQTARNDATQSSSISIPQKIHIARQLATAVLQFHATPWLRRSWNSREIIVSTNPISEGNAKEDNPALETYLSAQIHGPHGPLARVSTSPSPVVVRNALLFRLGVMLLEIAYASPLASLIIDRDRHSSDPANIEYFAADRLCRQVSAHMGPKYAEIARKCIHCDFGCDFDLKLSKLQEGFYQDVICELEKLEDSMKEW